MVITNEQIGFLLHGCRKGDRSSQKQVYDLLNRFALKTCYIYGPESAQEMAHEAFIKLFKHINRFDERRHSDLLVGLKGWFKRILVNACIDYLRKNELHKNVCFLRTDLEFVADKSDNGFDNLSCKDILQAIRKLTPGYRTVFNLYVIDGMSHQEISSRLGISVGTSKSNLSKARQILRSTLTRGDTSTTINESFLINNVEIMF